MVVKNGYIIEGSVCRIKLRRGGRKGTEFIEALIDMNDFPKANELPGTWVPKWNPTGRTFYAQANSPRVFLHRWLLGVTDRSIQVDHVDHDGLNNRRYNLNPTTVNRNGFNRRGAQVTSRSGKRNVYWHKPEQKWEVSCVLEEVRYSAGYFSDVEEADKAAIELRRAILDGTARGVAIRRGFSNKDKTHCKQGHPFSQSNTWIRANGRRVCIACDRTYHRRA